MLQRGQRRSCRLRRRRRRKRRHHDLCRRCARRPYRHRDASAGRILPPSGGTGANPTVAADGTTQFVFENTASVGTVEITTRIAGGGDVLTGACYAIDGGDAVCDADDGAEDGVVTFTDLRIGTYTFTQEFAPTGYEPAAALVDVNVVAGLNELTVENIAQTGTIVTNIIDEGGQPLGGACVSIQGVGDRCDNGTEDANPAAGTIQTNGVALGAHDVAVLSVPDGYDIPQGPQVANVAVDSPATVTFTVSETPPVTSGLDVTVQFDDDTPIEGACVTVTSSVEGVEPVSACDGGETDTNGQGGVIGFDGLARVPTLCPSRTAPRSRAVTSITRRRCPWT